MSDNQISYLYSGILLMDIHCISKKWEIESKNVNRMLVKLQD